MSTPTYAYSCTPKTTEPKCMGQCNGTNCKISENAYQPISSNSDLNDYLYCPYGVGGDNAQDPVACDHGGD